VGKSLGVVGNRDSRGRLHGTGVYESGARGLYGILCKVQPNDSDCVKAEVGGRIVALNSTGPWTPSLYSLRSQSVAETKRISGLGLGLKEIVQNMYGEVMDVQKIPSRNWSYNAYMIREGEVP
jgi:hypothetical protein